MIKTQYVTQKNMHSSHPIQYKEEFNRLTVGDVLTFLEKRTNDDMLTVSKATTEEISLLANQLHQNGWHQCNKGPLLNAGIRFAKIASGSPTSGYYGKKDVPSSNDVLCHVVSIRTDTGQWGPWEFDVKTIYVNRHQFPAFK